MAACDLDREGSSPDPLAMNTALAALKALPQEEPRTEQEQGQAQSQSQPGGSTGALKKVSYTHDAMIDLIIANPNLSQGALAANFGYTQAWVSRIMSSDAFQERLAARRKEIVNPALVLSIDEKLSRVCHLALDKLADKLEGGLASDTLLMEGLDLATRAKGYGAKDSGKGGGATAQVQVVVQVPQKSASAEEWQKQHNPRPETITVTVEEPKK